MGEGGFNVIQSTLLNLLIYLYIFRCFGIEIGAYLKGFFGGSGPLERKSHLVKKALVCLV